MPDVNKSYRYLNVANVGALGRQTVSSSAVMHPWNCAVITQLFMSAYSSSYQLVAISCLVLVQIRVSTTKRSHVPFLTCCQPNILSLVSIAPSGNCDFSAVDPVMLVPYIILFFYDNGLSAVSLYSMAC